MYCLRIVFFSKRYCRVAHYLLILVFIITPVGAIELALAETQLRIEVFTTTDLQFIESVDEEGGVHRNINLQVYKLDGIQLVEAELSRNLTADPVKSQQILLQRIQGMDEQTRMRMQRSANGIAIAMQYGIERYPAIVFDGQAIVYGLTDLQAALAQYQTWRAGNNP